MSTQQRLKELAESQATGETARIYGEIRYWSGVPMVALIYRHMATLPGVLEWAWEILEPLMTNGLLQETAWQLAQTADMPQLLDIPPLAREAAGISPDEEALVGAALAAFNRSNPINMLALRCVQKQLHGAAATEPLARRTWQPPAPTSPLPAMLDPNDMTPAARAVVDWICHRGTDRYAGIWPSLYRYLAHVPPYLGFAAVVVPPHFEGIDLSVARLTARIDEAATMLAGRVPRPKRAAPAGDVQHTLSQAIDNFTLLIPEMVILGTMLERATLPRLP